MDWKKNRQVLWQLQNQDLRKHSTWERSRLLFSELKIIYQTEGVTKGLYKGFWARAICDAPYLALYGSLYPYFKTKVQSQWQTNHTYAACLGAMMAALVTVPFTHPFNTIAVKIQAERQFQLTESQRQNYQHSKDQLKTELWKSRFDRWTPFRVLWNSYCDSQQSLWKMWKTASSGLVMNIPKSIITNGYRFGMYYWTTQYFSNVSNSKTKEGF